MKMILDRALSGETLTLEEVVSLLALDTESKDVQTLLDAAHEASLLWTGGQGYIWASIGVDCIPCPTSCSFCSHGEKWGIVKKPWALAEEEILDLIRVYDTPEVRWISIRTTEFYPVEALIRIARLATPLKHAQLVANTGEYTLETAHALHEAGFRMTYHVMRLREGVDTGVNPADRMKTLKAAQASPLELSSLVDPVGPEHTNEEIAASIFLHKALSATLMGAMGRFAVPGTPKYSLGTISPSRLAQITAVVRLAAGPQAYAICTHPTDERIVKSGANTVVLEYGAIPRDTSISTGEWRGFTVSKAAELLRSAGYEVGNSAYKTGATGVGMPESNRLVPA